MFVKRPNLLTTPNAEQSLEPSKKLFNPIKSLLSGFLLLVGRAVRGRGWGRALQLLSAHHSPTPATRDAVFPTVSCHTLLHSAPAGQSPVRLTVNIVFW